MQASTELCLAFFEFFTVLEKNGFFNYTQSPKAVLSYVNAFAFKYLKKAKNRSDIKRPVKQLKTQEKVLPFQEQAFSAFYVSTYKALRCRPPSDFWSEQIEAHALIYPSIPKHGQSNRRP